MDGGRAAQGVDQRITRKCSPQNVLSPYAESLPLRAGLLDISGNAMKHSISHGLDLATAKRVLEKAAASYTARFASYKPVFRWLNDAQAEVSFSAMGMHPKADMKLSEGAIDVDMQVPLLLRPFRQKAIDAIEREVRAWVEKAKTGEV
jgi:hypothetical protein